MFIYYVIIYVNKTTHTHIIVNVTILYMYLYYICLYIILLYMLIKQHWRGLHVGLQAQREVLGALVIAVAHIFVPFFV